eukprot:538553_1
MIDNPLHTTHIETHLTLFIDFLVTHSFYAPWSFNIDFGDSVSWWSIGYKPNDVLNDIFQPNKNENIFIAVSDFSIYQGWSDGAYWTANQNLVRNFNVPDIFKNQTQCTPF